MLRLLFILIGIVLAAGVYMLYQSLSNESLSNPVSESPSESNENTSSEVVLSRHYTSNKDVLPNGYIFTLNIPANTEVRVENSTFYRLIYAGMQNEPPALTDGVGVGLTVIEKDASTTLQEFVAKRFENEAQILSTTYTTTNNYGRDAYRFDVESELNGGPVEHIYFALDDEQVVFITIALYGTQNARSNYQRMVEEMLTGLSFYQIGESGDTSLIEIISPEPGSVTTNPVVVSGEARGGWYFEASFPVDVVDWDGRIVGQGYATAQGDWMTESFVPFEGTVQFELTSTSSINNRGAVILRRANASGLPEHDAAVEIPIHFNTED